MEDPKDAARRRTVRKQYFHRGGNTHKRATHIRLAVSPRCWTVERIESDASSVKKDWA
ncbi:hypothetical protein LIPSTDRAFT_6338 [Lipomyces starkeyi NRRL Y-11557]|uniref:Uncharacterized protein n=1 Tax=Lipomyces starkeyi NRRL Y-11557 TaxID=675824 RepID=A0A1E3PXX9_LIPST|nr:hypothetical protein LIPSTDRAFT_6338 [Lipomyces starkeyi NRRL Y-11557]